MFRLLFLFQFVFLGTLLGQTDTAPLSDDTPLGYKEAFVLGVVEGVTEYLPVSSTGHLILANMFLGLDEDTPFIQANGMPLLDDDGQPLTVADAADAYAVVIQIGAIAAVALLWWRRVFGMVLGLMGKDKRGLLLVRNLLVAFLPAAILGILLRKTIKSYLFGVWPVVIALVAGGILMLVVERWRKRGRQESLATDSLDLPELSVKQSLFIGLMQCVAMWPGTSRSMMTLVGGYLIGLSPARAAEFSFLLGMITLSAAAVYEGYKSADVLSQLSLGPLMFGVAVAFLFAALSVKWMVGWLTRHGLSLFAWYRFALAAIVFLLVL